MKTEHDYSERLQVETALNLAAMLRDKSQTTGLAKDCRMTESKPKSTDWLNELFGTRALASFVKFGFAILVAFFALKGKVDQLTTGLTELSNAVTSLRTDLGTTQNKQQALDLIIQKWTADQANLQSAFQESKERQSKLWDLTSKINQDVAATRTDTAVLLERTKSLNK